MEAEEIECPECGQYAAQTFQRTSSGERTTIRCYRCGHESDEFEPYEDVDEDEFL